MARLGTRCHVLQKDVPHARAEVQPVVGGGRHATTADGERVRGAGVGGGEGRCGPNAGSPTPAAPLTDSLGVIRCGVVAPVSGESGNSAAGGTATRRAGAEGRGRSRDRGGRGQGRTSGGKWRGGGGGSGGSWREGGGAGGARGSAAAGGPVPPGGERQAGRVSVRRHPRGVGGGGGGGEEDGGGGGPEAADGT